MRAMRGTARGSCRHSLTSTLSLSAQVKSIPTRHRRQRRYTTTPAADRPTSNIAPIFVVFHSLSPARSHVIPATNLLRPPLVSISITSRFPISIPVHRPLRHPLQAPRPIPVSRRREAGQGRCHSYLIHCAPGNRLDSCALLLASLFSFLDIRPLCLLSVLPLRYPSRSSDCDLCDELSN
ncbi:hypothetical protein K456DRAFT_1342312 [Colletotrichum gloeosporioides 23]|nr:hypothetical protein K456DRAFT_1342312 [Colletotrichum gloeosporioides 23]